ncbi:hypothetical protein [Streptomyces sp. NPDC007883]|uniref:hypothetical protein n=1 Tax=Streptomyces sp. NPDC007883 TaxID=3155116 RepID=UPI0033C7A255
MRRATGPLRGTAVATLVALVGALALPFDRLELDPADSLDTGADQFKRNAGNRPAPRVRGVHGTAPARVALSRAGPRESLPGGRP